MVKRTEKRDKFLEIKEKKEVEAIISNLKIRIGEERVKIENALGRVSSEDVFSSIDIPPFNRATMDGYAVVASDTFYSDENKPSSLLIKGYVHAGDFPSEYVESGSCMGISTGAPVPRGANAVVMVEHTTEYIDEEDKRKKVKIYKPVAPSDNIMSAGSDIMGGERIIRKGTLLTPRETGVLAACGFKEVLVYKKPIVAVISTGNEIIPAGKGLKLKPEMIYDVNSQTIADSIKENGGIPLFLGIARDIFKEITEKIKDALGKNVDVIMVSGGTSAGVGDILPEVMEELGEVIVHGVDIKPGKPFIFGFAKNKPIFGLPGYPTSALIVFNVFIAPLLRRIACIHEEERKRIKAKTATRIFSEKWRNEYLLVSIARGEEGFAAYPILTGSGAITSLSKADGVIYVEKGIEIIEEREDIEVQLLTKIKPVELTIIGSHCIGFDMLLEDINAKVINVGSIGGLEAIKRGEADIAPINLLDEKTGEYNIPFLKSFCFNINVFLVRGYEIEAKTEVKTVSSVSRQYEKYDFVISVKKKDKEGVKKFLSALKSKDKKEKLLKMPGIRITEEMGEIVDIVAA